MTAGEEPAVEAVELIGHHTLVSPFPPPVHVMKGDMILCMNVLGTPDYLL